jgi:large subunit ribosomal protein L3
MSLGLIGKKIGMTRILTDDGAATPVTVINVEPNRIVQKKTAEKDGYEALQVTTALKV